MNTAIGSDIAAKTGNNGYYIGEVSDPGAPTTGANGKTRKRQLLVVSEQIVDGHDLALSRAEWEMNQWPGGSQVFSAVCDSWRDKDGTLWQPNAFAPLYLPQLKVTPDKPWIIGQVSFVRDEHQGTLAELTVMPKEAFRAG